MSYTQGKCGETTIYNGSLYKCISQTMGVNGEPNGCGIAGIYCNNVKPDDGAWGTTAWQLIQSCM
jgi:hypothetical protein